MKFLKAKKYSILSNVLKYSFIFIFGMMLLVNSAAAVCPDGTDKNPCPDGKDGGSVTTGTNIKVTIDNPLGTNGPQTIMDFIKLLVKYVLYIGIPVIALAIIYTGFLFVSASGNSEKLTKAKSALLYTLIGGALLLGAFVIANAIRSTVDEIKKRI